MSVNIDMPRKSFFLIGDGVETAISVDFDPKVDNIKSLQSKVGPVFHIVDPAGITFHINQGPAVEQMQEIAASGSPIGLLIDGQHVRSPQGPEGLPVVGSFYEIYPDHLGNHARLFRKYGSVIKTVNMGKTLYLTESPEVAAAAFAESTYFTKYINSSHPLWGIKDNTATFIGDTETENWRISHRFLPPAMTPRAVKHYTPLMQATVRDSLPVFDALSDRGESWNVYQYMLKLASQTIGKFALNLDLHHFDNVESPLHPMVTSIAGMLSLNKKVTARGEWYRHLPFGDPKRLKEVQQAAYGFIQEAVTNATNKGATPLPLANAALQASCFVDYLVRGTDDNGETMPTSLILSNMVIVTGAGFTTTSSLLSWLIFSLVNYEGAQERLLQELVDNDVNNERDWNADDTQKLEYLDKFVKETQRLHNPSFQPGRTTKVDCVVAGGFRIPADSVVVPAIYAIHTNPKIWRDPQRFDPDRWDTPEVKKRHRCSYVPFATGPRGCIGFNFALQEVKVLFSELVYRYEFVRDGDEAIEYDPEFQLIRPLNFYVAAKKRTVWPEKSA